MAKSKARARCHQAYLPHCVTCGGPHLLCYLSSLCSTNCRVWAEHVQQESFFPLIVPERRSHVDVAVVLEGAVRR
jgi:hypothetical protein